MPVASPGNRYALHRIRAFGYRGPWVVGSRGILHRCEAFRPSSDYFQRRLTDSVLQRLIPILMAGALVPRYWLGACPPSKGPVQFSQIGSLARNELGVNVSARCTP